MLIPASPIDHAYVALAGRYIGRIAKKPTLTPVSLCGEKTLTARKRQCRYNAEEFFFFYSNNKMTTEAESEYISGRKHDTFGPVCLAGRLAYGRLW